MSVLADWLFRLIIFCAYGVGPFFAWYLIWAGRQANKPDSPVPATEEQP